VIIVGAGPIGLTLALALGRAGIPVTVLERRTRPRETSRAIGITPASLEIFDRYGVADELIAAGTRVSSPVIHDGRRVVATVHFRALPSPYRFILSLPQQRTEEILRAAVERLPSVRTEYGCEVQDVLVHESTSGGGRNLQDAVRVVATGTHRSSATESSGTRGAGVRGGPAPSPGTSTVRTFPGSVLCGCDGKHSTVRSMLGTPWRGRTLPATFVMADIVDTTDLADEAHLFFTPTGSVEAFPLPGGIRRWIAQTDSWIPEAPDGLLQTLVAARTPYDLTDSEEQWRSSFQTERRSAREWFRGPVFLAGDAAHLMPPIGGQGMNVGIGDAEHLADALILARRSPERRESLAAAYQRRRSRAFAVAARRSIAGMNVGAARGPVRSAVRSAVLRLALRGQIAERMMEHFAMIASPHRRSPWRTEVERGSAAAARNADGHSRAE
jgi:2-polyprenyl-6-methoxyphenol hydroxylase-like FAD-dependent oxidoreductase